MEFGLVQAAAKASDLEQVVAAVAVEHDGAQLSVGASAGLVALNGSATSAQMIDAADQAMYARKKERRG